MFLGLTSLITALAISAVAIYYSVAGLAAIFAAAVIPIVVMGVCLELGKLVTAVWLHKNWHRATWWIKTYLSISVVVLMIITSMGIFGFLSKAHTDQAIITGDVSSQVALYDEQIKIERENIANAKSLIAQMDATVQGIIASGESREIKLRDGRTYMRSAAEQALQVRRSQAKDRANLTKTIEEAQNNIVELQKKKAPIAANMREVEAKVGPIKYIAQLIYGENPDQNLLEKAVTWVIIVIIFVFDPLAVLLLIAAQMSFKWYKEERNELVQKDSDPQGTEEETPSKSEPVVGESIQTDRSESTRDKELSVRDDVEEANRKIAEIEPEFIEPVIPEDPKFDEKKPLEEWNEMIAEAERAAKEEDDLEDQEIINTAHAEEKAAMQRWKSENPDKSLKTQRRLYKQGKIEELPWMEYLKAEADFDDDAAEAAKWALEQIESKKKDSDLDGETGTGTDKTEQRSIEGYIQNAEQSSSTIWKRVKGLE